MNKYRMRSDPSLMPEMRASETAKEVRRRTRNSPLARSNRRAAAAMDRTDNKLAEMIRLSESSLRDLNFPLAARSDLKTSSPVRNMLANPAKTRRAEMVPMINELG
jgi:hypothetical protein